MKDQAQIIAKTLLAHLKEKGDTQLIGQIVDILVSTPEYKNSKCRVVLSSAATIESAQLKDIRSYLERRVGKDYEFVELIDPSLVAGFTLQINDTFIDASVLGKINTVSNKLTAKD